MLHGKWPKDKLNTVPGPGSYNPNYKMMIRKCPVLTVSTGPRLAKDYSTVKDVPGPGRYNFNLTLNGPMFKFLMSKRKREVSDVPGPGAYRIPCTFAKTADYLIPNRDNKFKFV